MKSDPKLIKKGIVWNVGEVQAFFAKKKMQHRQPMMPQPVWEKDKPHSIGTDYQPPMNLVGFKDGRGKLHNNPFGKIGDILWIKEDFCFQNNKVVYRADDPPAYEFTWDTDEDKAKWQKAATMPFCYSRILIQNRGAWAEPLQNITADEAEQEGADMNGPVGYIPNRMKLGAALYDYGNRWSIKYESRPKVWWDKNPWVWAMRFVLAKDLL